MFPSAKDLAASGVQEAGHDAREVAESDGPSGTTEDKDLAGGVKCRRSKEQSK